MSVAVKPGIQLCSRVIAAKVGPAPLDDAFLGNRCVQWRIVLERFKIGRIDDEGFLYSDGVEIGCFERLSRTGLLYSGHFKGAGLAGNTGIVEAWFVVLVDEICLGVNDFQLREPCATPLLKIDENIANEQIEILQTIKNNRNNEAVQEKLERLKEAAQGTENLMPFIMDAIRDYASIGEVMAALKEVFGEYREDSIF